jgi:hypothetical protein
MLSPHTPPGTKIVCINAQDSESYIREGEVYTVRAIVMGWNGNPAHPAYGKQMFGVQLEEVAAGVMPCGAHYEAWGLRRFRVAELPKCLTDLLVTEMV